MSQKTKTRTTELTLTTEEDTNYKRMRMKEVRYMVAQAVKQNVRVDLMEFEGTDIPRAMIALQDMLHESQARHKKASNHIAGIRDVGEVYGMVLNQATDTVVEMQHRIAELSQALHMERTSHEQTATLLQEMLEQNEQGTVDLEATMNALRVALQGEMN